MIGGGKKIENQPTDTINNPANAIYPCFHQPIYLFVGVVAADNLCLNYINTITGRRFFCQWQKDTNNPVSKQNIDPI